MNGLIVEAKYGSYKVYANDQIFECTKRGALKNDKISLTVGDYCNFDEKELVIENIMERKSILKRPSIANVDQLIIVFSLVEPDFSYYLAFKYVTYANKYGLDSKIVLTKSDKNIEQEKIDEIKNVFSQLGIDVYVVSSKTKEGIEETKKIFKDKISCLIGQSGVGKSSLLNAIDITFKRKEGQYSEALGRGKHETKEVVLLKYEGGFIADTPGFSSLDLDLFKEDLAHFFPGFSSLSYDCYFTDCLHISEKKCKVKEALNEGRIPSIAYQNYLKLSNDALPYIRRFE